MRNIHVISTEKASKVISNGKVLILLPVANGYKPWQGLINRHIYITSNKKIRDGDWYYWEVTGTVHQAKRDELGRLPQFSDGSQKIILTTDVDLVNEGVEAIDDTFLEWFVQNPGLEEFSAEEWMSGEYVIGDYNMKSEIEWVSENPRCKQPKSCYGSLTRRCICPKLDYEELSSQFTQQLNKFGKRDLEKWAAKKNLHMVPTEKPTGIFKSGDSLLFSIRYKVRTTHERFHIYITNDDEIKEGEWFIFYSKILGWPTIVYKHLGLDTHNFIKVYEDMSVDFTDCKKIILTTDPDLIKAGVQSIDDEFLEWFVRNPECEEVEIEQKDNWYIHTGSGKYWEDEPVRMKRILNLGDYEYKIIIPRGEPKQEALEEAAKDFIENTMKFSFDSLETRTQANRMLKCAEFGAKWQREQILEFLYLEITERRPYSSSRMCEVVIEFIEQFKKE